MLKMSELVVSWLIWTQTMTMNDLPSHSGLFKVITAAPDNVIGELRMSQSNFRLTLSAVLRVIWLTSAD